MLAGEIAKRGFYGALADYGLRSVAGYDLPLALELGAFAGAALDVLGNVFKRPLVFAYTRFRHEPLSDIIKFSCVQNRAQL
jgi:hypothetical protein